MEEIKRTSATVPDHLAGKVASTNCTGLELHEIHPALMEAAKLQRKKSEDYGSVDHAKTDYFPLGDASYYHMLWMKLLRIRNLRIDDPKAAVFEGARDSLLDLINYASFYVAWLDEEREKEDW